jgi:hypothetical protein
MATAEEIEAAVRGEAFDAVIVSLRPGTKAKPAFTYRPWEHPEWLRDDSYSLELPAAATSPAERRFNGGAWPTFEARDTSPCAQRVAAEEAEAAPPPSEIADIAGQVPPPEEEAWLKEILFTVLENRSPRYPTGFGGLAYLEGSVAPCDPEPREQV